MAVTIEYVYLVRSLGILRWEEPKEQSRVAGRSVGQGSCIGLADIEVDFGDSAAIDGELLL